MTAVDTYLENIESLDFDAELPCEHPSHEEFHADQPGTLLVATLCPDCLVSEEYVMCESGWAIMAYVNVWCLDCDWTGLRDQAMVIIRRLNE